MPQAERLQGYASFPGDEVVLAKGFGVGEALAAGGFEDEVEDALAHFGKGRLAAQDGAGIEVDDVGHAIGEGAVGGEFEDGSDGIAGGGAEASGEEDKIRACADLSGDGLDIVAGRAEQGESAGGGVLGIIEDIGNGSGAGFARGSGGLDGVGEQAVADVARGWIHLEAGVYGACAGLVGAHEGDEALGGFRTFAAVDEVLFDAAQFGKFGEDGASAEGDEEVRDLADGGVGGDAAEAVRAAAFEADGEGR